jgi:hypothetical protein
MTKEEVIKKIGADRWDEFCDFMAGQTCGIAENGEYDYYDCDVENFLRPKYRRFWD